MPHERHTISAHSLRRGVAAIAVVVTIPLLIAVGALVIDVGQMYVARSMLQATADASALSAANALPSIEQATADAIQCAGLNQMADGAVNASDIEFGSWNRGSRMFSPGGAPANAVRVTARRATARGNAVSLYFGRLLGLFESDLSAQAVAVGASPSFRFLIDDTSIGPDVLQIQQLADSLGTTVDTLLGDANGDGFIDLPAGVTLELPTGATGNAGLHEATEHFPFTQASTPSLDDFLHYDPLGAHYGIADGELDNLVALTPVADAGRFDSFINPDLVLVSPIYRNSLSDGGGAGGERRGLVAYKIKAIGADPDGAGPKLPNLVIEIASPPSTVDVACGPCGALKLVH